MESELEGLNIFGVKGYHSFTCMVGLRPRAALHSEFLKPMKGEGSEGPLHPEIMKPAKIRYITSL